VDASAKLFNQNMNEVASWVIQRVLYAARAGLQSMRNEIEFAVKFELLADLSDHAAGSTIRFDGCTQLGAVNLRGTRTSKRFPAAPPMIPAQEPAEIPPFTSSLDTGEVVPQG